MLLHLRACTRIRGARPRCATFPGVKPGVESITSIADIGIADLLLGARTRMLPPGTWIAWVRRLLPSKVLALLVPAASGLDCKRITSKREFV